MVDRTCIDPPDVEYCFMAVKSCLWKIGQAYVIQRDAFVLPKYFFRTYICWGWGFPKVSISILLNLLRTGHWLPASSLHTMYVSFCIDLDSCLFSMTNIAAILVIRFKGFARCFQLASQSALLGWPSKIVSAFHATGFSVTQGPATYLALKSTQISWRWSWKLTIMRGKPMDDTTQHHIPPRWSISPHFTYGLITAGQRFPW